MEGFRRVIISRTDSIGDVVLTLPMAGLIKRKFPKTEILFLGQSYTRDVINSCIHVDTFVNWDDLRKQNDESAVRMIKALNSDAIFHVFPNPEVARLARKAGIPYRLGTTNRLYHWSTCNKLVRLSRRRSKLHEAQLNLALISNITGEKHTDLDSIKTMYGFTTLAPLSKEFSSLLDTDKFKLILHPKSKGSAREWGMDNFIKLCKALSPHKYRIFISGTSKEGELMKDSGIFETEHVTNITGQMNLQQFMSFIGHCDGLVAASTGPLHLAAAMGKTAIGIYPPIRPMHPGRWAPIGVKATFLVKDKECSDCRSGGPCQCMLDIQPEDVIRTLEGMS